MFQHNCVLFRNGFRLRFYLISSDIYRVLKRQRSKLQCYCLFNRWQNSSEFNKMHFHNKTFFSLYVIWLLLCVRIPYLSQQSFIDWLQLTFHYSILTTFSHILSTQRAPTLRFRAFLVTADLFLTNTHLLPEFCLSFILAYFSSLKTTKLSI